MKAERAIETFKKIMAGFGCDLDVRPADPKDYDCEGAYIVGSNVGNRFNMDLDIVPAEIEIEVPRAVRNILLNSEDNRTEKVRGFVITGYKPTPYRYDEPPDVEDFIIGTAAHLSDALNQVINFYIQERINNAWESASMEEMAEDDNLTF